jgi:hypothetical protein
MTTLVINGKKVKVADSFLSLSPEEQNRTVDEIASSMGAPSPGNDKNRDPRDGMTPGERAKAARGGTLKPPSEAKLAAVSAADKVAETKIKNAPTQAGTFLANLAPGVSFGFADEIAGGIDAALTDRTYDESVAMLRGRDKEMAEAYPKTAIAGQIAGAMALPIPVKGGATVKEAAVAGAKVGAGLGFIYGTGTAEGGVVERIKGGIEGAISGGLFGAAAPVAVNFGSKAFQRLFGKSAQRPTLESLKATKTAAYNAVDDSGEKFAPYDLGLLVEKAKAGMDDINYLPQVDDQTAAMLKRLDALSLRELTIGQVDKLRQDVWTRYNKSKELGLLEIIDGIDEMIAARTSTSDLMDAARVANSRYKKAELLDLAFQKAADQTAATGSGGNVLNKMRQAVTNIINNPKQAKWFTKAEIDTMRGFVQGSTSENVLRRIGKLAPTGNGLMTALNLMAGASFGAPALAVSGVASGAKAIADSATERGAQRLIGMVAGQPAQAPVSRAVAGSGVVRASGPASGAISDRFVAKDAYGRPLPMPEY